MRDKIQEHYVKYLEWESLEFPIQLTNIKCDKQLYDIPENAIVEVWRGVDFKLNANIYCRTGNQHIFEIDNEKLDDNFIPKEILRGSSLDGFYSIELEGCVVINETSSPISLDPVILEFKANISIQNLTRKFLRAGKVEVLFDWFLSAKMDAWFPRSTSRSIKSTYKKVRQDIDPEDDERQMQSWGGTRDYTLINVQGSKCIVAIVPAFYEPTWAGKICIEYRASFDGIPSSTQRKKISEYVGFILGSQLLQIGSTEIDKNQSVVSQFAMNQWGDNAMGKCSKKASPPVKINMPTKKWERLEELLNQLLPKYMELESVLHLSAGLWKYWVGCDLAVGTNLPILSSAVDGLAGKYLQKHSEIKMSFMDSKEYEMLISEELAAILTKLEDKEFKDVIGNKIKGAVFRGANEKMELFFKSLNLPVGSLEKKAMRARNVMAHASIEGSDENKLKEYAKLTQVYQTLFHRVMLRMLGYEGDYTDYYSSQISRPISEVVGGS